MAANSVKPMTELRSIFSNKAAKVGECDFKRDCTVQVNVNDLSSYFFIV